MILALLDKRRSTGNFTSLSLSRGRRLRRLCARRAAKYGVRCARTHSVAVRTALQCACPSISDASGRSGHVVVVVVVDVVAQCVGRRAIPACCRRTRRPITCFQRPAATDSGCDRWKFVDAATSVVNLINDDHLGCETTQRAPVAKTDDSRLAYYFNHYAH